METFTYYESWSSAIHYESAHIRLHEIFLMSLPAQSDYDLGQYKRVCIAHILSGKGEIEIEGKMYECSGGNCLVFPLSKGAVFHGGKSGLKIWCLACSGKMANMILMQHLSLDSPDYPKTPCPSDITTYFTNIYTRVHNYNPAKECLTDSDYYVSCIIYTLLTIIVTMTERDDQYAYRKALQKMRDDMSEPITVEELASLCGFSKQHFIREFKSKFGETPHAYLQKLRLEKAKGLLISSDAPISDIARAVGYQDPSAFTEVFRRTYDTTPRNFRLNNKE